MIWQRGKRHLPTRYSAEPKQRTAKRKNRIRSHVFIFIYTYYEGERCLKDIGKTAVLRNYIKSKRTEKVGQWYFYQGLNKSIFYPAVRKLLIAQKEGAFFCFWALLCLYIRLYGKWRFGRTRHGAAFFGYITRGGRGRGQGFLSGGTIWEWLKEERPGYAPFFFWGEGGANGTGTSFQFLPLLYSWMWWGKEKSGGE